MSSMRCRRRQRTKLVRRRGTLRARSEQCFVQLPDQLLKRLGLQAGDALDLLVLDGQLVLKPLRGTQRAAFTLARTVFASDDLALAWMNKSHELLQGRSPLGEAKSTAGATRVQEILLAIKYGGVV